MHWMLRLVDVAAALAERGYPRGVRGEVDLEVRDDLLPWNHGRLTLEVADGVAEVRRGGNGDGVIALDVRGLASIYSGFAAPAELVPTGLVAGDADDLARLGSIFAGPSPWLSDGF